MKYKNQAVLKSKIAIKEKYQKSINVKKTFLNLKANLYYCILNRRKKHTIFNNKKLLKKNQKQNDINFNLNKSIIIKNFLRKTFIKQFQKIKTFIEIIKIKNNNIPFLIKFIFFNFNSEIKIMATWIFINFFFFKNIYKHFENFITSASKLNLFFKISFLNKVSLFKNKNIFFKKPMQIKKIYKKFEGFIPMQTLFKLNLLNKKKKFYKRYKNFFNYYLILLNILNLNYKKLLYLTKFNKGEKQKDLFYNIKKKKIKINKSKKNKISEIYLKYFFLYFFEKILSSKVSISIKSLKFIYNKPHLLNLYNKIVRKYYRYNYRFKTNFFIQDLLEVLCITLKTKDVKFFIQWFCFTMQRFPIFRQRKYMQFLRSLFSKYLHIFLKFYKCFGFYLDVRGKLGVKGNAKKRHMCLKYGKTSISKKSLKLLCTEGLIQTRTGVLGVTFMLSFK